MPQIYTPDPSLRDDFVRYMSSDSAAERAAIIEQLRDATPDKLAEFVLLVSQPRSDQLLDPPNVAIKPTGDVPHAVDATRLLEVTPSSHSQQRVGADFQTGEQLGPYKIREKLGEGGMGVVYVAEQTEPVRRKVALKIIKPGMDSQEVIARFEAERQALAMMSHPNIARVFDGGTTPRGRPYFVMELVKGVPITAFCDQQQFDVSDRLKLFATVCEAVQHAHMKGIIHRDLKPSNIIVEMHDVKPVVKVIDFGISKATGPQLAEHNVYTKFAQLIGTPLYMSPEQAQESSIDVDTRSDVYSLGVLLYELLTGSTPFDREALGDSGLAEMRRIICEVEPPRPSERVSTLRNENQSTVAESRKREPLQLGHSLRGELDWIVMKALEKKRSRRYQSAKEFADDVERYLRNEPVIACPPSLLYRSQKFFQRHRAAILTAGTIGLLLVGATVIAMQKERAAVEARNLAQTRLEQEQAARQLAQRRLDLSIQTLKAMYDDASLLNRLADASDERQKYIERTIELLDELDEDRESITDVDTRLTLAELAKQISIFYRDTGDFEASFDQMDRAIRFLPDIERADVLIRRANLWRLQGMYWVGYQRDFGQATPAFDKALEIMKQAAELEGDSRDVLLQLASIQSNYSLAAEDAGNIDKSQDLNASALETRRQLRQLEPTDNNHRRGLSGELHQRARLEQKRGEYEKAKDSYQEAIRLYEGEPLKKLYKEERGFLTNHWTNLAQLYDRNLDDHAAAIDAIDQAIAINQSLVDDFPTELAWHNSLSASFNVLGTILDKEEQLEEKKAAFGKARAAAKRAMEIAPDSSAPVSRYLQCTMNLIGLLDNRVDFEEKYRLLSDAIQRAKAALEVQPEQSYLHFMLGGVLHDRAIMHLVRDEFDDANQGFSETISVWKSSTHPLAKKYLDNALSALGTCLIFHPDPERRNPDAAEQVIRELEAFSPDSPKLISLRALKHVLEGEPEETLRYIRQLPEEETDRMEHLLLALAHAQLGEKEEAEIQLSLAREDDSDWAASDRRLEALVRASLGDEGEKNE